MPSMPMDDLSCTSAPVDSIPTTVNPHISPTKRRDVIQDIVRLSYDLETPFTLEGTLMNGAAGLAVTQELLRRRMPHLNEVVSRPDWSRLSKHLVPLASGIGTLNPRTQRFDLSHEAGSAGILATLNWAKGNATLNLSSLLISPLPHSDESDASSIDALGSMHES